MADGPRTGRISRSAEFDRVYRQGRSSQHRLLVLYRFERPDDVAPLADESCRLGVTITRKVGGAVVRNLLKRQLLAALRDCEHLDPRCDYVAIARPGLPQLVEREGFAHLAELVDELAAKLRPAAPAPR